MARVSQQRKIAYNDKFHKTVNNIASRRKSFTVDDVIDKVGNPPQGRTAVGPLMNAAAQRYNLRVQGQTTSAAPSRNGASVTVWSK